MLQEKIKVLQEQLDTENLVSDRIRGFVQAKTSTLQKLADQQDKTKDKSLDVLQKEIEALNGDYESVTF